MADRLKQKQYAEYLAYLVEKGARDRYKHLSPHDWEHVLIPRIKEELRIINKTGFAAYFLIVADIINWCKRNGIPVGPARGSAGGAVVSYCLRITDVDPLKFDLIFERFLNDERVAPPDIDVDLCWARRQEVIDYVVSKYGDDHVAQIITFGTLSVKALLDDLGKVFRIPKSDIEELKRLVPDGEKIKLIDLVKNEDFIKKLHEIGEKEPRFIPAMVKLEGLHRHASMHAGGIIISSEPMTNLAPIYLPPKAKRQIVQYEMMDAESVGLLKMDLLGLRTVTLIDWAEKDVRRLYGENFHTRDLPLDIREAFDIINRGDTAGIFQLEGTGITRFAQELRIDSFDDIVALLALYRPGPLDSGMAQEYIDRKNHGKKVEYPHPDLEPILKNTYGIIIYQEQVMRIVQVMAGYTLGQADVMRKAMGKKDAKLMEQELDKFKQGALSRGYPQDVVNHVAELIRTFARYGFNKSHSVAYAYLTYWCAVLKAKYPVTFFTAWLNTTDDGEKQGWIIEQAVRRGINILPPDINLSGAKFTGVDRNTIRFGLSAVKGVGGSLVEKIVANREKYGEFKSYWDFCYRMQSIPVDKKEALVGAGAFDFDPHATRAFLYKHAREINDVARSKENVIESIIDKYLAHHGMESGLDIDKAPIIYSQWQEEPEYTPLEKADLEKQYVNFYISADPIKMVQKAVSMVGGVIGIEAERLSGNPIIGGRITNIHPHQTRKGDQMAFVTIDDGIVSHSVTFFPSIWKKVQTQIERGANIAVKCEINRFRGKATLQALDVYPVSLESHQGVDIVIDMGRPSPLVLAQVKMTLDSAEPGDAVVWLYINNGRYRFLLRSGLYNIKVNDDLIDRLASIVGKNNVRLQRKRDE